MRNWRTTIIGALLAGAAAIGVYQSNGGDLADWKLWVIPALLQILGYLAKDAGVTGSVKALLIGGLLLNLVSCTGFDWKSAAKRVAIAAAETSLQQAREEVAREMAKANPDQTRLLMLQFSVMQAEQLLAEAKGEKGSHDVLLLPSGTGAKEAVLVTP